MRFSDLVLKQKIAAFVDLHVYGPKGDKVFDEDGYEATREPGLADVLVALEKVQSGHPAGFVFVNLRSKGWDLEKGLYGQSDELKNWLHETLPEW